MLKLYYLPGACSMVPHTALEWIGEPYEAEAASREFIKSPEYLKLNPQGAVPLLVDGDFALPQNVAILAYLDMLHPKAKLFGSDDAKGRARAYRWLSFLNADVHKAFGPLFHTPAWVEAAGAKAAMQKAAQESIVGMFAQADAQLAKQPQLADALSVADVYLYVLLRWANSLKMDLSSLKHVAPFYDRMSGNPHIQAVVKQEGVKP